MMTSKQRLLAAIRGEETDRLAFSPFLAYWWESMPQLHEKGDVAFLKSVGADPLLRGTAPPFRVKFNNTDEKTSVEGRYMHKTITTPAGELHQTHTYAANSGTWFLTEHPVKTRDDFAVLQSMFKNAEITPDLPVVNDLIKTLGEEALILPLFNITGKTCFQALIEHWVGTEELAYALYDYPETVEETLEIMRRKSLESTEISLGCGAEGMLFFEDTSTANYSPAMFEKYIAPEIRDWARLMYQSGKFLVHHACGNLRGVIKQMGETGADVIESISPPPTGDIELWEAAGMLPGNVALIGGIEPTVILGSTMEDYEAYVRRLILKMKPYRFIIANSDSCPPGTSAEKFALVGKIIREDSAGA